MTQYQVVGGTSYHAETSDEVVRVLERARILETRITVDYGDVETGRSWGEVNDITGYVARSTGPTKVPLLLYNRRSTGAPAMLDHCIVRIRTTRGKRVLYQHPKFHEDHSNVAAPS